jgi:hypothetical protein
MDIYGYLNNSKPNDATSQVNSCLDYISNTKWVVSSKIKLGCADIYSLVIAALLPLGPDEDPHPKGLNTHASLASRLATATAAILLSRRCFILDAQPHSASSGRLSQNINNARAR